ncbi:hypothetical protein ACET8J_05150 [Aeromonas veronii]
MMMPIHFASMQLGKPLLLIVQPDDLIVAEEAFAPLDATQAANHGTPGRGPARVIPWLTINRRLRDGGTDLQQVGIGLIKALDPGHIAIDGMVCLNQLFAAGIGAGDQLKVDAGPTKPVMNKRAQYRSVFDRCRQL